MKINTLQRAYTQRRWTLVAAIGAPIAAILIVALVPMHTSLGVALVALSLLATFLCCHLLRQQKERIGRMEQEREKQRSFARRRLYPRGSGRVIEFPDKNKTKK